MPDYKKNIKYDYTKPESIVKYARSMEGHTLEEISEEPIDEYKGKGGFGQILERYGFNYEINSDVHADFEEVGIELKVSPLTTSKKYISRVRDINILNLKVKERMVLCMFDFNSFDISLRHSHLWEKISDILIVFYRYQSNVSIKKLKIAVVFRYILEHRYNDFLIINQDYKKITDLVKIGKAHQLSEGITNYLGVCRKGQGGKKENKQPQPNSSILTYRRAFCFKISYMNQLWKEISHTYKHRDVFSRTDLENNTLDEVILNRLRQFNGLTMKKLSEKFHVYDYNNKSHFRTIINELILENKKKESNEIKKAGITVKVIRIKNKNKMPFESMCFPNIQYKELVEEKCWEDSHLYSLFSSRFLFVVLGQDKQKDKDARIIDSFLWNMPSEDEQIAKEFWQDCKLKVRSKDLNHFWKISDDKKFHVRPKGKNSLDLTYNTPDGDGWKKYSYWMNASYIRDIIINNIDFK